MALSQEEFQKQLQTAQKKKFDLKTAQGLAAFGQASGLGDEVGKIMETKPKLSFLQRLGKGLGAFNPAEAYLTGKEQGIGAGLAKYATGIVKGIGSAITGIDYEGERRTFADVAENYGIKNGIAKFGIGFLGDVLLDPSTYFGGALARGVVKGAGLAGSKALVGIGRFAPETETGLRMAGTGLQDALGRAFVAGYKSTKGAQGDLLEAMSKRSQALFKAASDQMADLGVVGLTDAQRMEVGVKTAIGRQAEYLLGESLGDRSLATKLVEGKTTAELTGEQTELLAKTKVKFDNPLQQKYFEAQQVRAKEFAQMADITDPYAVYYPFLKKEVLSKFVNDIKRSGVQMGSEPYTKQFKNIMKIENIELDPRKSFGGVQSQIIHNKWARETLDNFVERYGKPIDAFKNADEARAMGYRMLREKGGLGKEVGWVGEWDAKLFTDLITPEFQTLNMLAKATGFDMITGLFKRSVTGLFLPFHIRNFVSGMIQNFEALGVEALNPKLISSGWKMAYKIAKGERFADDIIEVSGKELNMGQAMNKFVDHFGLDDSTFIGDVAKAFDEGGKLPMVGTFTKERAKETVKTLGLGKEALPFKMGRTVAQFIEVQQKATAYLTALGQGKTVEEALELATKAGFDYRVLTQFESQVMRRLIPFYSFTRKNIELQLKTLGENPQRINQVMALIKNIGSEQTPEEKQNLPDYLKETLGISLGVDAKTGLTRYVSSFGTPIEAFANLFKENNVLNVISQMNPLIKAPVEIGIGKDSFRQKDLKDVYDAKEYSDVPQVIKDLLQIHEVTRGKYKQVGSKLVKTGEYTQYVADPERLLIARSLFTSRGFTYLDNVFDKDLSAFSKFINLVTGIKAQQINPEITKVLKEKEQRRALEDLFIRLGKLKEFRNVYEPKK